jgi:hypothetical protein
LAGASGKGRSAVDGVGLGETKATFLAASLFPPVVTTLPLVALREVLPVASDSWRGDVARLAIFWLKVRSSVRIVVVFECGEVGDGMGVESVDILVFSLTGGNNGRPMSGSGLIDGGTGVVVTRCGGHSGRGPRLSSFSLVGGESLAGSLSFESPLLIREKRAFMVEDEEKGRTIYPETQIDVNPAKWETW